MARLNLIIVKTHDLFPVDDWKKKSDVEKRLELGGFSPSQVCEVDCFYLPYLGP